MRVLALPGDEMGCGHYRIVQPCRAVEKYVPGVKITIGDHLPTRRRTPDSTLELGPVECDVMVIQRPMWGWMTDIIPQAQKRGIRVVCDVDDDFHALHPDNQVFARTSPKENPDHNWHHLHRNLALADLITVSTSALKDRYGAAGRCVVVPNYVSESLLDVPREEHDGLTVGWAGIIGVHPGDLQVTRGGVADAVEELAARFVVVGTGDRVEIYLGLKQEAEVTGWLPISDYFPALTRFDVGIVPLAESKFAVAKSNLKGLEYAAVGTPFVASSLPEYERLAAQGVGLLAKDRSRSWRQRLVQLAKDDGMRAEMVAHGRQVVREHYLSERNAWRTAEAWEEARR